MSLRINTNVSAMNAYRNVGETNNSLSKSMTRLSTGLRINDASDDPAGLIISEKFRAQISGIETAIQNSQDAVNYAKTAEGALAEVNTLMRDARSLAVASANTGALTAAQIQANQNQINSIVASINRIATNTQFGTKKLLDGSSGVNVSVTNGIAINSMSIGGSMGGNSIVNNSAVNVQVTTAAAKGTTTGTNAIVAATQAAYLTTAVGTEAGSFTINGETFTASATDTWGGLIDRINQASGRTGVVADSTYAAGSGAIRLTTSGYGTNAKINLADANGVLLTAAGTASAAGVNAVATVTAATAGPGNTSVSSTFTGGANGVGGLILTDSDGNRITLTEAGNAVATLTGAGQLLVGSSQFQIGGNAGQTASLSLGNFSAATLGIDTLDVTSASGATTALTAIDNAIDTLTRSRGDIGSFQRNVLESNIRSLGVAKENLTATESTIRDTDVASEMTNFTKLQILQQSGMAMLAQANSAPQSVLSLLKG
jgi:flagellin